MVGGRGVEPGTSYCGAIDDDGTGACVVEGWAVGIGEVNESTVDVSGPAVTVAPTQHRGTGAIHRQRTGASNREGIGDSDTALLEEKQSVVGDDAGEGGTVGNQRCGTRSNRRGTIGGVDDIRRLGNKTGCT